MENIFCSKCGTSLVLPVGLENSQFIKCCNCDNTFKNPHFESNPKIKKEYPLQNTANETPIQDFIISNFMIIFVLIVACIIAFMISNQSGSTSYDSNSKQSTQSESSSPSYDNNSDQSKITAEDEIKLKHFKGKVQILFDQLMIFKNDKYFQEVGFGGCCKYNKWMKDVEALVGTPEAELFNNRDYYLVNELGQLGRDYIHLEGRESEYTNWNKKRLIEALKEK